MPKKYTKNFCVYCGKPQRLSVIQLLCEECIDKKKECKDHYYDYYSGEIRGFIVRFT
jgi:hypothetical protein